MAGGSVLEARHLSRAFGGIFAVSDMSLTLGEGTITGLIGPNGAGKSTLFNLISGVIPAQSGSVLLFGEEIRGLKPHEICRRGLTRTFQLSRELGRLTVLENVMLAPQGQPGERLAPIFLRPAQVQAKEQQLQARALEVLDLARLGPLRNEYAANLSGGQKKLLELARALMTECPIILLDEPGAGVNPTLMATLADLIVRLNAEFGKTFLVVEHDMPLVAKICDPVVVMTEGRRLIEGSFAEIRRDPRVIEAYLGSGAHA